MFRRSTKHSNHNNSNTTTNLFNQIEIGGESLGAITLSRRVFMRRAAGAGVAALAVGALGGLSVKPAGASAGTAQATVPLNLRSGPSTSHKVLRVIPAGGAVAFQGDAQNGFS